VIRTVENVENPVDPWIQWANTPDIQHIKALHNLRFTQEGPDSIASTGHSLSYPFTGAHTDGSPIQNTLAIYSTSLYYQSTDNAGRWFGFLNPMGLPRPGWSKNYMVIAAGKDMGSDEEITQFLDFVERLERGVVAEDLAVMSSIKFRLGSLTRADRTLAQLFDYMRSYPRATRRRRSIRRSRYSTWLRMMPTKARCISRYTGAKSSATSLSGE
jgi:hypothetical protein